MPTRLLPALLASVRGRWVLAAVGVVLGPVAVWLLAQGFQGFGEMELNWLRCLGGVLVLGLLVAVRAFSGRFPGLHRALAAVLGLVLLATCVATVDASLRHRLGTPRQVSTWNFFHYYLGSKYFAEVGYDGLYEEALKADHRGPRRFSKATRYRDMETYRMKRASPVRKAPPREAWTRARWKEFKRDVAVIGKLESRAFWKEPLRDRGYNPPPGWSLLGGTACKLLDAKNPWHTGFLMWIDPALMLAAFFFSVRTYGFVRSALALLAMASWIGTHRLFGGKVVQYEWLAATWVGLCCMRRGRFATAGVLLAYATSVRVFPGALMLGPAGVALFHLWRHRSWPARFTRLFGAGTLALIVFVIAGGLASGRGVGAWLEFAAKNSIHHYEHKFSESRIGLPFLSTASLQSGISSSVSRASREQNYADNTAWRVALQLLVVGLLLAAARRGGLHDTAVLGLALIFAFAVSSRYYGAVYGLLLLAFLPAPRGSPLRFAVRPLDLVFLFALLLGYWPLLAGADARTTYMLAGVPLFSCLLFALAWGARAGGSGPLAADGSARAASAP